MSSNIFGQRFQVMTFGESHGVSYGLVIDGMPAGILIDDDLIAADLKRRQPGQNNYTTSRNETDHFEILSGVFESKSIGTPIAVIVRNQDQRSQDYSSIKDNPRIGHADDVWKNKFGHADHRGGGRSSGRETLCRVIAGSFAKMVFKQNKILTDVMTHAVQIGPHQTNFSSEVPDFVQTFLSKAVLEGESYGGIVECIIKNPLPHLGQPIFHKFKADLASAMLSLGAVEGFEFGAGFSAADKKGSDFHNSGDSKNYGGIRGGITTGEDISFKVVFKPTSSIKDIAKKGRHDPCIVIRALPVVESMVWLVLVDHYLWTKTDRF